MSPGHSPQDARALLEKAAYCLEANDLAECIRLAQAILKIDPDHGTATHLLGVVSHRLGDLPRAKRLLRHAIRLGVDSPEILSDLGRVLIDQSQWDEASRCFEHAITRFPDSPTAAVDLGYLKNACGRFDEAIDVYEHAIARFPSNLELWTNLATLHRERGNLDAAIELYDKIESQFGSTPSLREARGRAYLQKRMWRPGWDGYEARLAVESPTMVRFSRDIPLWNGESLAGKSILVLCEQGIGDEVQFASCLPELLQRCRECTVTCSPRLEPIFVRSFPQARIMPLTAEQRLSSIDARAHRFDFQTAIGSLPRFLRTCDDDFPQAAYLLASPPRSDQLRGPGKVLRVGISWWGGSLVSQMKQRSVPFEVFSELLAVPCIEFVNLQHGRCDAESVANHLQHFSQLKTYTEINPYVDLDAWFDLIGSLDLVITVDNSNAHFAGALGIETWLLLAEKPNWRWPYGVETSQWYPAMTFFRQTAEGGWAEAVAKVRQRLSQRAGQPRL